MLQSMVFRNVGLFKSTNVIKFSNDDWTGCLGVLVGMNGSGKTMATECIRRCLHSDMSHSDSTIPDPTTPSYILCKYELDPKLLSHFQGFQDKTINEFFNNIQDNIQISGINGIFVKDNVKKKFLELSITLRETSSETGKEASLLLVGTGDTGCYYHKENAKLQNVFNSIIQSHDKKGYMIKRAYESAKKEEESMIHLEECLKLNDTGKENNQNDFNEIFRKLFGLLEGTVIFVYPMRGIGAAMGSEADEMITNQSENYMNAVRSSNMMTKYWKLMKEDDEIENEYNHIINTLIPNCRYKLALEEKDDKEVITLEDLDNPVTGRVPILKTPEGIFEAILFSLCLASRNQYTTICYDEPSRCMHRQLVDNMASYITELVKEKKVCLVLPTHSPCFISEETWYNITYFQRRSVQDSQRESSVLQCQTFQNDEFNISKLRFFSQEHIRTLVFAKKILWVEGETDQMFVQKLLAYLKCGTHLSKFSAKDKNQIKKNSVPYGSIKVMYVNGKRNMDKMGKLCGLLNISYRILYDRDKVDNKKDMMTGLEHCLSPEAINKISKIASYDKVRQWFEKASHAIGAFVNSLWTKENLAWRDVVENSQFTSLPGNIGNLRKSLENITGIIEQKMEDLKTKGIERGDGENFDKCLQLIKRFTESNRDLKEISNQDVSKLKALHADLSLTWPRQKDGDDVEFYWSSNAIEEVLEKCAKEADKPLLERQVTHPRLKSKHKQFIWYFEKDNETPGHIKSFTCKELNKLTEFVLDNATDEIKAFVMFLTKFAEE